MKYITVFTNNVPKQGKNMQVNLQRHGMDMLEVSDKKLSKSSKLPFWRFFKKLKIESCSLQSAFILLSLCFENQL